MEGEGRAEEKEYSAFPLAEASIRHWLGVCRVAQKKRGHSVI